MIKYFKFISIIGLIAVFSLGIFGATFAQGTGSFGEPAGYNTAGGDQEGGATGYENNNQSSDTGGLVPCGIDKNGNGKIDQEEMCTVCDFFVLIDRIIDFISIKIAPYLVLLLIIAGAFMMIVSGGSEAQYAKGKTIITSAIVGLLIIWGSWLIIDTIMSGLTSLGSQDTAPNFIPWYTIQCE